VAAGKGVVVTEDRAVAVAHASGCARVVVEEYLDGPELSLFAVVDGRTAVPLLPAQDYKRIGDGDTGPNTGGMGAYAPLPWAPPGLVEEVMARVVRPTVTELARRGSPFAGLLYAGLAITKAGLRVIEFNCRFGDPETQVVLALLDTPLAGLLHAAATGQLAGHPPLAWRAGAAVPLVVAPEGDPGRRPRGAARAGRPRAGPRRAGDGSVRTAGGRVLSVTGTGDDLAAARQAAYDLVSKVGFPGAQYRTDIALRAVHGEISLP